MGAAEAMTREQRVRALASHVALQVRGFLGGVTTKSSKAYEALGRFVEAFPKVWCMKLDQSPSGFSLIGRIADR